MRGGVTCGYCVTGSFQRETRPETDSAIDITAAKRGRSMKKREKGFREAMDERRVNMKLKG
jgi:hypothetical protein